jgi:phage terminase large subunit
MPSLRGSAMRDFFHILNTLSLYDEKSHNKTENLYKLNGNIIEFISLDESIKVRGRKRDYLFLNEANEVDFESFKQLAFRTTDKIILDYNPHQEYSWIYDNVITRDDAELFISTYKDNSFLDKKNVDEIERLKYEDENYWRIYGLGLVGISIVKIYNNWRVVSLEEWEQASRKFNETYYGLDFGFNVPTALIELNEYENEIWACEKIYEKYLLNSQLIDRMNELGISRNKFINADNAEPDKILEIQDAGYNIYPADKSVNDGIDYCQRKRIMIHPESVNLIKEIKNYSWKTDKAGKILDEPVKANDHACDALRYGVYRKRPDVIGESDSYAEYVSRNFQL